MADAAPAKASSSSLDPKLMALLAWLFAPISSIIFMLLEDMKKDEFIQYHAKLSLIFGIATIIVSFVAGILMFIPFLGACVYGLTMLGLFAARIYYMVKAYNGEKPTIPVLSDLMGKF